MIVYRELSSIEADLGIPVRTLYRLSNNLGKHYHEKKIPKSDGSMRTLSVPDETLKKVQRAIAERLLAYEPVSVYAKAYRIGTGIASNAAPHVGKEKILKLDIYHFFDSIRYSLVKEKCFPEEKYAEQIRILLAMLCYHGDSLPQGAPTSPVISNIVMRDFDIEVGNWCAERKIAYSRYCDDMTFSGDLDADEVKSLVAQKLKELGFILNEKKTLVKKEGEKMTVTGIVVNDKLNTSKDYRRKIRAEIHFCQKYGVRDHLLRNGNPLHPSRYLDSLLGRINYVLEIDPRNKEFLGYKQYILRQREEIK